MTVSLRPSDATRRNGDGSSGGARRPGRLSDKAIRGRDTCKGEAITASANVMINNLRALRVGDKGACGSDCDGDRWEAMDGAAFVLINNRRVHRIEDPNEHDGGEADDEQEDDEDQAQHASEAERAAAARRRAAERQAQPGPGERKGGNGQLATGSPNVLVGDLGKERPMPHDRTVQINVGDAVGRRVQTAEAHVRCPHQPPRVVKGAGVLVVGGLCEGAHVVVHSPLEDHKEDP